MKKIIIHKKDDILAVIQKILDCRETEITLFIPNGSALEHRGGEFYLILRESKAAGKQISIETKSERIIEYGLAAGIKIKNLPSGQDKKPIADIIPKRTREIPATLSIKNKEKEKKRDSFSAEDKPIKKRFKSFFSLRRQARPSPVSDSVPVSDVSDEIVVSDDKKENKTKRMVFRRSVREDVGASPQEDENFVVSEQESEDALLVKAGRVSRFKRPLVFLLGLSLIFAAVLFFIFSPKLEAHLVFKKINWIFSDEAAVAVQVNGLADKKVVLPAQFFRLNKNLIFEAEATEEKRVENRAVGKITIYNAYSSRPQPLVEETRFVTPEGKVFLLTRNITVPGARIREGRIVPSSIEAEVVAEQPGEEHNLGPVSRLSIPGFRGGPRYGGFYGELKEPTKGGFVGKVRVPTENDILSAREEARNRVRGVLLFEVLNRLPERFKILDGAALFTILREEVDPAVSPEGKFRVFIDAEKRALAFRDEDLINGLRRHFFEQAGSQDFILRNYTLSYQLANADSENNVLNLRVEFNSQWIQSFDKNELKEKLAGQKEAEIRAAVLSLAGIDRTRIKLSPFWVRTAPLNPERIEITFE